MCERPNLIELVRPQVDMDTVGVEQRRLVGENWVDILYQGAEKVRAY